MSEAELDRWRATLSAFAGGLAVGRHVLTTEDEPTGDSPWPPEDLPSGPLPSELQDEARALLREADELTAEVRTAMTELGVEPRTRTGPSYGRRGSRKETHHARWSFEL